MKLTAERLKLVLSYDANSGIFTWRKNGSKAGSKHHKGYWRITIDRAEYLAHRLAWLYVTGGWPADEIDHRNRIRSDNRFANLREATGAENRQNIGITTTTGTSWCPLHKKWRSCIWRDGKKHHLGYFPSIKSAHAAYISAKRVLHPFQFSFSRSPSP